MRIVADTNVLLSGVVSPTRAPGQVIEALGRGQCTLVITARLWAEFERALGYRRIHEFIARHGGEASVTVAIARLQTLVQFVPSESPAERWLLEDDDDNWVIQCAITGRADYIVTGDSDLLGLKSIGSIQVVTPRQFADGVLKNH